MGTFVENSLIAGEQVEATAEISWMSQIWYFIFAVIFFMTLILPVVLVAIAFINVFTTELAVTNKKIIGKAGFIRRASVDLPLNKLESLTIDQGLFGRIFNYGRVSIRGTGGNNVSIPYIKSPLDFRRVVMGIVDQKEMKSA